ncbi:hypothetical protein SAMN05421678_11825 [Actinopolymorpha cephalotaxi]|uniref:Uncharacterized protein n=1 Tax=Actinopolymorpha cephalotaxi TaxID=504797 RepID=A0A1I3A3G5_9ACTN|nr:hypothetical protein [Actinopolymorpha cephalotaxi]SFH44643.1 hypothetical protein SAMN05421678_11825 [Actinopolymorpha cephalotaxi]
MKKLGQYWGYLIFALLIAAWWSKEVGPVALVILSALVTLYFLFRAPGWCGAETRQHTLCRNNAYGLLLGCHFREHKRQN